MQVLIDIESFRKIHYVKALDKMMELPSKIFGSLEPHDHFGVKMFKNKIKSPVSELIVLEEKRMNDHVKTKYLDHLRQSILESDT